MTRSHPSRSQLSCFQIVLLLLCNRYGQQSLPKKSVSHSERTKIPQCSDLDSINNTIIQLGQKVPYKFNDKNILHHHFELSGKFFPKENLPKFKNSSFLTNSNLELERKTNTQVHELRVSNYINDSKTHIRGYSKEVEFLRYSGLRYFKCTFSQQILDHNSGIKTIKQSILIDKIDKVNRKVILEQKGFTRYSGYRTQNYRTYNQQIYLSGHSITTINVSKKNKTEAMEENPCLQTNISATFNNNSTFTNININDNSINMTVDSETGVNNIPNQQRGSKRAAEGPPTETLNDDTSCPMQDDAAELTATVAQVTWEDLIDKLQILHNHKLEPVDKGRLLEEIGKHKPKDSGISVLIQVYREQPEPTSMAKKRFKEWTSCKPPEVMLEEQEVHVVKQYLVLLHTEMHNHYMHKLQTEEAAVCDALFKTGNRGEVLTVASNVYSGYKIASASAISNLFDNFLAAEGMNIFHGFSRAGDNVRDELISLEGAILSVSPEEFRDESLNVQDNVPFKWSETRQERTKFTTDSPVAIQRPQQRTKVPMPALAKTYRPVSSAEQKVGRDTQNLIRRASERGIIIPEPEVASNSSKIADECTQTDKLFRWTQYMFVTGLYPKKCATETCTILQNALDRVGEPDETSNFSSGLKLDEDFAKEMHRTREWKVKRHQGTKDIVTGHIIKLKAREQFGTFHADSYGGGKIHPATFRVYIGQNKSLFFQCIPEPVHLDRIQQPAKYPALCALRAIPVNKDRHALTTAALFAVECALYDNFPPGSFTINPITMFHKVTKVDDISNTARSSEKVKEGNVPELIWEVLFLKIEEGVVDGNKSKLYQEAREKAFKGYRLRQPTIGVAHSTIIQIMGFRFEMLDSIEMCIQHPERPTTFIAPTCTIISNVPAAILAEDVIRVIAIDEKNHPVINAILNAVTLPPVQAKKVLPWRVLIQWESVPLDIAPEALFAITDNPSILKSKIPGYETYFQLQSEFCSEYASNQLNNLNKIPMSTPSPMAGTFIRPPMQQTPTPLKDNKPARFFKEMREQARLELPAIYPDSDGTITTSWSYEDTREQSQALTRVQSSGKSSSGASMDMTTIQGFTLQEFIQKEVISAMNEQGKKTDATLQAFRSSITDTVNEHAKKSDATLQAFRKSMTDTVTKQLQGVNQQNATQVLYQRAEFLNAQITKLLKDRMKLNKQLDGTHEERVAAEQEIHARGTRLSVTFNNIAQEARDANITIQQLGLPDFRWGQA